MRAVALLALVAGAAGVARAQGAAPAEKVDKVAVLPLHVVGPMPARTAALEAAVEKGLAAVVAKRVLVGPDVGKRLSAAGARVTCSDPACWMASGRALAARHLVAGVVERKDDHFKVEFRLVDAQDGRVVLTETNKCEAADCSVAELSRLTVLELARKGLSSGATPAGATPAAAVTGSATKATPASSGAPASAPPPASSEVALASPASALPAPLPDPAPTVLDDPPAVQQTPPPPGDAGWRSWFPVAGVVTGLVAGGVGGYLISKDGDCIDRARCSDFHDTRWWGVGSAAAGALLLTSGIVVGFSDFGKGSADRGKTGASTGLVLQPHGIALRGRF